MTSCITSPMAHKYDFISISLPKTLVDKIDAYIERSDSMYKRPHVIKTALNKFFNNGGLDGNSD